MPLDGAKNPTIVVPMIILISHELAPSARKLTMAAGITLTDVTMRYNIVQLDNLAAYHVAAHTTPRPLS